MSTVQNSGVWERTAVSAILDRASARYSENRAHHMVATDRLFQWLLLGQWAFAVVMAWVFSPYGWEGKTRVVNAHVWVALLLGGVVVSLPIILVRTLPGARVT